MLLNLIYDSKLFFEHSYQRTLTRRTPKEEPAKIKPDTYKMLHSMIRQRLNHHKKSEIAVDFIKDVRDKLKIMDIMRSIVLRAEMLP